MAGKPTNCSECAYVDKSSEKWWCPFHDLPVSSKKVCDDFLDEFGSPQWGGLIDGMNDAQKKISQYTVKDIIAYLLTGCLWGLGIAGLVLCMQKLL